MLYPNFFDKVESILLYDPLSDFLGAVEAGAVEITYLDVVKFAGHSCPTVAGAYLMTKLALERLYPDALPHRGEVRVLVRGEKSEGVNGVIGNTIAFICGVSDEAGFKGIGGRYDRSEKLHYGADIEGEVAIERIDNGLRMQLRYDPSIVPPDPQMKPLMQKILSGQASSDEIKLFRTLWQERVEKILLSKELWPKIVTVF